MYKKDRIKLLVAIAIMAVIGITYWWREENDTIVKTVAVAGVVSWLVIMFILNKKDKEN